MSKQAKKYIKKIKKNPMDKTLKKGISTATIPDALNTNQNEIHQTKRQLLKKLISDEEILNIMTQEENLKKN